MRKARIDKLKEKYPHLTKEVMFDLYVKQEKSLPDLLREQGIDYRASIDLLNFYDIPRRNVSQSRLTPTGKSKIRRNFVSKHGVENPSQLSSVKEKKRQTFISHYGVDNIWKSPEYYSWLNDYMLVKYGKRRISNDPWGWKDAPQQDRDERIKKLWSGRDRWWNSLDDEQRSDFMAKISTGNTSSSKIESRVAESLSRMHIDYDRHVFVGRNNFDFRLNDSNILIEVHGDFWHANPKLYTADDVVNHPGKKIKAADLWDRDNRKVERAKQKGFRVIVLWESDMNVMTDGALDEWLAHRICE